MIDTGFIDHQKIFSQISNTSVPETSEIDEILLKARELKGLNEDDVSKLLRVKDTEYIENILNTADFAKSEIYGKRLVLFAPLYISNLCNNECLYCGFRKSNKGISRKTLSMQEIARDTEALINEGHKRILLVSGEGMGESALNYTLKAIDKIYSVKNEKGDIRRINVNIAPVGVDGFKKLKNAGIGTYQLFQETYHYETFKKMHPSGKKSNYLNHLGAMDEAMEGGVDDVGIGTLFGLYDPKFEVMALLAHNKHLEKKFGVGCHTISIPRIEPADNSPLSMKPPYKIDDEEFKKIIAILRLAVPYTGIILSTRENADFRREAFRLGISQISAGSKTDPGGYSKGKSAAQFSLGDHRPLAEVIDDMLEFGYIPSFCTGCYRLNRTGADFMDLAKPGLIKHYCLQNGLTSFQEYLTNFAEDKLQKKGGMLINSITETVPKKHQKTLNNNLDEIKNGKKDVYI